MVLVAGLISGVVERVADARLRRRVAAPVDAETPAPDGERRKLAVVGNGMVSLRFCQELVRLGLNRVFAVTVIGEESVPAYDRVNLAHVLRGKPVDSLTLAPAEWYRESGIELRLGAAVTEVDANEKAVVSPSGREAFDVIVFATGSSAVVPKIEGADAPGVSVYRSERDARRLRQLARDPARSAHPVLVVGAGLLGLEAAAELKALGCDVELVESGDHLLPRQLDQETAVRVEAAIERAGHRLHKGVRATKIRQASEGLVVELDDESSLEVSTVVLAVGVRPRDDVARAAGLACDLFGGIVVKDDLSCSKQGFYAIGECTRHRGLSYGIVAPGYQMAEVLAQRLAGHDVRFRGATTTTRLKSPEVEVCAVGQSNVDDLATSHCAREDDEGYRRLVVRRGRLIGLAVVGNWNELHLAQQAIVSKRRVSRRQLSKFERGESLFGRASVDLRSWPADAPVCSCTGVTCGSLRGAHARGAVTPEALTEATGAGSVCGSCKPLLASLCSDQVATLPVEVSKPLVISAGIALVVGLFASFGPPLPYADTVQVSLAWDEMWRQSAIKQLTGYSLVVLTLIGLAISVRRRFGLLRRFEHASLRTFHVVMGVFLLVVLAAHTGFRPGANLDWLLGVSFVGSALVGAVAAIGTALDQRFSGGLGGRLRRGVTSAHIWLVWPLPALVLAHVVKVYFF